MKLLPLLLFALALPGSALAQAYPTKPVRMVVGFPPGGGSDTIARMLGRQLNEYLGQPVVIDNKPGADTNIASEFVARAQADGYTLLLNTGAIAINMSLYSKVNYDAVRDFSAISLVASAPLVAVVGPTLTVKSIEDLIAVARNKPGYLNYSSAGGPQYLAAELFKIRTKTNIVHVPYKGSGPSITALMGGEVHLSFSNIPTVLPHVKAGRLHALAVAARSRTQLIPDVPTMKEAGVNMEADVWYGLFAPAATPRTVIRKLADYTTKATRSTEMKQRLLDLGAEPVGNTPEEFAKQVRAEVTQWAEVVKISGAKPN
jgi:tripartite-type tricarboxylate transporter receptor subunit TctC